MAKVAIKTEKFESLNLTHYQVWTVDSCVFDANTREECEEWVKNRRHTLVSLGEINAAWERANDPSVDQTVDSQIQALRYEADKHGDHAQVALCDRALRGDGRARLECERVIRAARAQD